MTQEHRPDDLAIIVDTLLRVSNEVDMRVLLLECPEITSEHSLARLHDREALYDIESDDYSNISAITDFIRDIQTDGIRYALIQYCLRLMLIQPENQLTELAIAYPIVLSDSMYQMLGQLHRHAQNTQDENLTAKIHERLRTLTAVRLALLGPDADLGISFMESDSGQPEPNSVLQEISRLDAAENSTYRCALIRHMLDRYDFSHQPELDGYLNRELAVTLFASRTGHRAANIEQSLVALLSAQIVYSSDESVESWAAVHTNLGATYLQRTLGDKLENRKRAIEALNSASRVYDRTAHPTEWATMMFNLAAAYKMDPNPEAQEKAITAFHATLEIFTPLETPYEYASAHASLAKAYLGRENGSEADDVERALKHGIAASTTYLRQHALTEWYQVQQGLAAGYLRRRLGDRSANIEEALRVLSDARELITYEAYPAEYAELESNLGAAYAQRISGDEADNIEQALLHYHNSLRVRSSDKSIPDEGDLQARIGNLYAGRVRGDKKENLETAIVFLGRALLASSRQDDQRTRFLAHFQLGLVYQERLEGDTIDNFEQALTHAEAATTEHIEGDSPENYNAKAWANLGTLYRKRTAGHRADNIDSAIDAYKIALENVNQLSDPALRNSINFDLGNTYRERDNGDFEENLNFAIQYLRAAVTDYALQYTPERWADTQRCLAECYAIQDDPSMLGAAIQASEDALTVYAQEAACRERAEVQSLLGTLLARRLAIHYTKAEQEWAKEALYSAAQAFKAALADLNPTSDPQEWVTVSRKLADLYNYVNLDKEGTFAEQRLVALNQALQGVDRNREPTLWADVQVELAQVYAAKISAMSSGQQASAFRMSIKHYQMALAIYTAEADAIRFAELSYSLATIYLNVHDTEQVIAICHEALEKIAASGISHLSAAIQSRLGDAYTLRADGSRSDNLELALAHYGHALAYPNLDLQFRITISVDLAMIFRQRVNASHSENLEESLKILSTASVELQREVNPRLWARVRAMLGIIYSERIIGDKPGNTEHAIEAFLLALEVRTRETDAIEWAETQINLARAYWDRLWGQRSDDIERARQCLLEVLDVFSWGSHPEVRIDTLINLAAITRERLTGDRVQNAEQAITYLEEVVDHAPGAHFRRQRARAQQQLGVAYVERIRGEKAENVEIAINALRAASRGFNRQSDPVEWAHARAELGIAYTDRLEGDRRSNTRRAIHAFKEAASIFDLHELPLDWAWMQHELGIAYKNADPPTKLKLNRSIAAFEAALGVRSIEATPHEWASSQLGLGNSYKHLQEDRREALDLAARCYRAAAQVFDNSGSPHDRRRAWELLGNACRDLQRWDDAVDAYIRAVEAADELYDSSILPGDQELELVRFTDLYASTAYAMTHLETIDLREAVIVLERGRAKRLGEVLSRAYISDLPELGAQDREALHAAIDELHALEAAEDRQDVMAGLVRRGSASPGSNEIKADPVRRRLARSALHARVEAARLKVRSYVNDLAEQFGTPPPTSRIEWRDISKAVKEGEPVAYLLAYGTETIILIVERMLDDVGVRLMRVEGFGERELADVLGESEDGRVTGGLLFGQLTNDSRMIRDSLPRVLSVLGGQLVSKLDLELRNSGARGVIVVPTNFLVSIPLHAASYEIDGKPTRLLEEFRVSYAPSLRALSIARQRVGDRGGATLAGIGNPSNDLIYAEAELRHISSLFSADAAHLLFRAEATVTRTLELLADARYVHLSCHGVFDPEVPLNSYLKLAYEDRVTLQDLLATQNLRGVRLVTASACSTAVTGIQYLADEVIGMPSAFIQAGAAGVVGTLWPVVDLSTALIMCRFYELYLSATDLSATEALEPADALRIAQCWLARASAEEIVAYCNERSSLRKALHQTIHDRAFGRMAGSAHPFADPYYWAPFVFVGA